MEHHIALASKASERYLLGEMDEYERFEFEAHFFDCPECAEDVLAGRALARGIQAVCAEDASQRPATVVQPVVAPPASRTHKFSWSWLPTLSSAFAVGLGCLVVWQNFFVFPGMRWAGSAQAISPIVLRAEARGEEQTVQVQRNEPVSALSLDVNIASPGTPLVYEVKGPDGVSLTGSTQAPPVASPLIVMLPNAILRKNGPWVLILRTAQGTPDLARYPFSVQIH